VDGRDTLRETRFALLPGHDDRDDAPFHLTPVPLQRWHFTTLSPFLTRPLPSQFLHFCFFLMFGPLSLAMLLLSAIERIIAMVRHILRQTTAKMI
jgi:hypothetical protein